MPKRRAKKTEAFVRKAKARMERGEQVVGTEISREVGLSQRGGVKAIQSKRFQTMLEEHFPTDFVLGTHKFLMQNSTLHFEKFDCSIEDNVITDIFENSSNILEKIIDDGKIKKAYYLKPDVDAMYKGLDMIYKIQDRYAKKDKVNININPLYEMDVDELKEKFAESYEEIAKPKPSKNPAPMIISMDEFDRQANNL